MTNSHPPTPQQRCLLLALAAAISNVKQKQDTSKTGIGHLCPTLFLIFCWLYVLVAYTVTPLPRLNGYIKYYPQFSVWKSLIQILSLFLNPMEVGKDEIKIGDLCALKPSNSIQAQCYFYSKKPCHTTLTLEKQTLFRLSAQTKYRNERQTN